MSFGPGTRRAWLRPEPGSAAGSPEGCSRLPGGPPLRQHQRDLQLLRFEVVAGPRVDPATLPHPRGVRLRPYVPDLYRRLAACDVALVQGGLTTCMELTAHRAGALLAELL